jgi:hypothetical protein
MQVALDAMMVAEGVIGDQALCSERVDFRAAKGKTT